VVTAVELQATIEPHCSRGMQPGGIYVYVVQREPTPGGPGSGLRPGRMRFASCRSGSIIYWLAELLIRRVPSYHRGVSVFALPPVPPVGDSSSRS
jgi:hypothetical protein